MYIKYSKEEKTIIDILFNNFKPNRADFKNFDFQNFLKICSSHLILPLIFTKLKEKKILRLIPKELKNYIQEIHKHNLNRNKELIKETNFIIDILNKNKINYVLLKGSAHLFRKLYSNLGDRMIGDIDILIEKKNGKKTVDLLNKYGYYNLTDDIFFDFRHLNRLINKKKIFAVEIHTRLFDNHRNVINKNDVEEINNVKVFKKETSADYTIYNNQINDFGYSKNNYSYRSLYDYYMLVKKKHFEKRNKLSLNRFQRRYFTIARELGIVFFKNFHFKIDLISLIRFRLGKAFKFYNYLERFVIKSVLFIYNLPKKTSIFLVNKKYRDYIFKKIKY